MLDRMRADLQAAMKDRDRATVGVLRTALAAVSNAEAQPVGPAAGSPVGNSEHVAGAAVGVGATEMARRELTAEDVRAVVQREVADHRAAARELARIGRPHDAEQQEAAARLLARYLG